MPLNSYFKGDGRQVYAEMLKRYGAKKGKGVFYATAQRQGQAPPRPKRRARRPKRRARRRRRHP